MILDEIERRFLAVFLKEPDEKSISFHLAPFLSLNLVFSQDISSFIPDKIANSAGITHKIISAP